MKKAFARLRITRWKHANARVHLFGLLQGVGGLLDGLVMVFSLGFFMSNFAITAACYRAGAHISGLERSRNAKRD